MVLENEEAGKLIPLEQKRVAVVLSCKGELEHLYALDEKLCHEVNFPKYLVHPSASPESDPLTWKQWFDDLDQMRSKYTWLLKLPYHKFWCQVINDVTLHNSLESYVRFSPRYATDFPQQITEVHSEINKLVFLCFIRMATHKENETSFMSPNVFGDIIYNYFLFDIPKLMDICVVYANEVNMPLLSKAVANIFKHNEGYGNDYVSSLDTIHQIIENLEKKCGKTSDNGAVSRLSESEDNNPLLDIPLVEFRDVVLYASDTFRTLHSFLCVYKAGCHAMLKSKIFTALPSFYAHTIPVISNALNMRNIEDLHLKNILCDHIAVAKNFLLQTINIVLNTCFYDEIMSANQKNDNNLASSIADEYIQTLSILVEEAKFFMDLSRMHGLLGSIKNVLEVCPDVEETRVSFLFGAMGVSANNIDDIKMKRSSPVLVQEQNMEPSTSKEIIDESSTSEELNILDSAVSSVKDMLPDLSNDFVKVCLSCFNNNVERTLNAILEDSLPDNVKDLNRQNPLPLNVMAQFFPNSITDGDLADEETETLMKERKNIFDNDEFDVFGNQQIDTSKIYTGKKNKNDDIERLDITRKVREKYQQYSIVSDVVDEDGTVDNTYDDEYDDTYDGIGIDANDADDADDLMNIRRPLNNRVPGWGRKNQEEEESSESEEEEKNRDLFIANPADIRAKNEEHRRMRAELRGAKKSRPKPQKNVVKTETITGHSLREQAKTDPKVGASVRSKQQSKDKPSTQQSDKEKKYKGAHKARFGNHNRKSLSTKKFSKGM